MEETMKQQIHDTILSGINLIHGDYIYWAGLLGLMKGIESSGDYECRAVFWFDN